MLINLTTQKYNRSIGEKKRMITNKSTFIPLDKPKNTVVSLQRLVETELRFALIKQPDSNIYSLKKSKN